MKKTSILLFLILGAAFSPTYAQAQNEQESVKKTIQTMFDGMRAGDSSMVHSVFIDDVLMQTISANRQGEIGLRTGPLSGFLNSVGTPHDQVWDERILSYEIKIDGAMASVWTPYEFYIGERFSHCGVNSFQLMKGKDGWKIIYLVDTRRRGEACK
ncbi:MAG: nuclear transport factor 2 family protein [Roseivirga sp.]|nr:nuclear transport factor 2 family protein [Roseivirga sp.]